MYLYVVSQSETQLRILFTEKLNPSWPWFYVSVAMCTEWMKLSLFPPKIPGERVAFNNWYRRPCFYPRPVLGFGYCRCLRLCLCVRMSVCVSTQTPGLRSIYVFLFVCLWGFFVGVFCVFFVCFFFFFFFGGGGVTLTFKVKFNLNFTSLWGCPCKKSPTIQFRISQSGPRNACYYG